MAKNQCYKVIALAALLGGCAFNRPYMREETTGTNGVVSVRITKATTVGLWPGTASVEKQKTTLGKTMSIGQSDVEATGGGTNVASSVTALTELLRALR